MSFYEDVKLTLMLAPRFDDRMTEKSLRLPSVEQTADVLVGELVTTLGAARESADIGTRKHHLESTRTGLRRLKRLAENCHELREAELEEVELQILQIERETEILEQRSIARRNREGRDLEKRGLTSKAIVAYERLAAKRVDTPFTYRRLAILYRKRKSTDDEIRILRAALKNIPKSNRKHYDWFEARLLKIKRRR